jgi:hypothetical protein
MAGFSFSAELSRLHARLQSRIFAFAIFRAEYARPADGLTRQAVISFGSIARRESRGCELDASCETVDSLRYTSKG